MSEYRESCIKYKNVRIGIIDQKDGHGNKHKTILKNWLAVYFRKHKCAIWKEYKTEAEAYKQMIKMINYWPMYVVEKEIYEKHYRHLT